MIAIGRTQFENLREKADENYWLNYACVLAEFGEVLYVDENHPAAPAGLAAAKQRDSSHGPGTELKALLAGWPFYIVSSPTCKCNARARYMDEKGCDWCESPEGMVEIMGFLREAAEERGLPFVDMAGRMLVRRAIANARKAEAKRAKEAEAAAAEGRAAV
jgi:hypothetical protein